MKIEQIRYKSKGFGLIISLLQVFIFFNYVPEWGRQFWPQIMQFCGYSISKEKTTEYKLKMYLLLIYLGHIVSFLITNMIFVIIYKINHNFFEKYKVEPNRKWPWEQDYSKWQILLKKSLKCVFYQQVIMQLILILFENYIIDQNHLRVDLASFPSKQEFVKQFVFFMISETTMFYWLHRISHIDGIYQLFHKQHHEYKDTISISSEYAHPVDLFLNSTLPTITGYKLLAGKCHLFTAALWIIVRSIEAVDGHCGYEFSWSPFRLLPFSGGAEFHNYHHTHNVGNYGSFFTFWDDFCGTSRDYIRYKLKKESQKDK